MKIYVHIYTCIYRYETWHLKGIMAEGANLHKPATVSGGGKSEISKRLEDMIRYGPVYVNDITADFDALESIFAKDFGGIMSADADVDHPLKESSGAKSLLVCTRVKRDLLTLACVRTSLLKQVLWPKETS